MIIKKSEPLPLIGAKRFCFQVVLPAGIEPTTAP